MRLNYSKEAIDSEFDLFEITTECDWFLSVCPLLHLSVCKYILIIICTTDSVCVCVFVCEWWMILSAQWFCTEMGASIRIVMLPCPVQCPHSLSCEPKEDHLSEISWKVAHLDGGWICTLCNWRQTQGAPDILASRVHWCNNCRKKKTSLWSQTNGPHFVERLLPA